MRRGSKPELIYGADKRILGVNLSADYCAEHEWGIRQLKEMFGIPDDIKVYGLKRRKATRVPTSLRWVEFSSKWFAGKRDVENGKSHKVGDIPLHNKGFIVHSWYGEEPYKLTQNTELSGIGLRTAWSEDDFAVVSSDEAEQVVLRELYDEFQKGNLIITFGGGGVFENPGLIIAVADRMTPEVIKVWHDFDKEQHAIKKEFAATGIEDLLKKAGKAYYALTPRRKEDGSLHFWLNPQEQNRVNYGWFTLEQLQLWAVDEGPIPKEKKPQLVN